MKQPVSGDPAGHSIAALSEHRDWRHSLWLALLVAASVVFSLGLACAVPLAAFAAAAALSLSRPDALLLMVLVWLVNQLVGFTLLGYPWDASTFAWGAVLGAVAILTTLAGQWIAGHLVNARRAFRFTATFLIAFAVYEVALFVISATLLGGTEIYTAAIQGRILAINTVAFVGFLALNHVAASIGLIDRPAVLLFMKENRLLMSKFRHPARDTPRRSASIKPRWRARPPVRGCGRCR